jgi:mevalonate kinase
MADLHYYGHGKLMLTGEYYVLDGAKALSIPTRFGQHLRVKELSGASNTLYWVALNNLKQPWLNLVFDKATLHCLNTNSKEAMALSNILSEVRKMNPDFLMGEQDIAVETYLEFPNEWGLGSSSTLIHCIATWGGVDGIMLLKQTLGGSGYDVASAGSDTPILYQLSDGKAGWEQVSFDPPFADRLYFVYTGQKQLSSAGIAHYKAKAQRKSDTIGWLDKLTESMLQCQSIEKMEQIIQEHEAYISEALELPKVKDTLFADYWGAAKSLGAWGGDYVLLTNTRSEQELIDYLHHKQLTVIHRYDNMLYKSA